MRPRGNTRCREKLAFKLSARRVLLPFQSSSGCSVLVQNHHCQVYSDVNFGSEAIPNRSRDCLLKAKRKGGGKGGVNGGARG